MGFFISSFVLLFKRLIRQWTLLACLLLIPIFTLSLTLFLSPAEKVAALEAAVFLPENSVHSQHIWQRLLDYQDEQTIFIQATSEAEIRDNVTAQVWDCGYIFPDDLDYRIEKGNYKNIIECMILPSTITYPSGWIITATLFEVSAQSLAINFLTYENLMPLNLEELPPFSSAATQQESRWQLQLQTRSSLDADVDQAAYTIVTELARGITSLLLFVLAYLWAVKFREDMNTGFFSRSRPYRPPAVLLLASLSSAALILLSGGFIAISLEHLMAGLQIITFTYEIFLLVIYVFCLICFAFIMALLLPSQNVLIAALPFWISLSLILSPIIFSAGQWIKELRIPAAILPTTLYLEALSGRRNDLIYLCVYAAILFLTACITGIWQMKKLSIN